jgi:cytochrome c oxidase cbb3-type subunit I/II
MWAGGLTEGLMWRAIDADGLLQYPNFVDIVNQLGLFYWTRFLGGTLYLCGAILMAVNVVLTIRDAGAPTDAGLIATPAK